MAFALVYHENIVIFSQTLCEHVDYIGLVFVILKNVEVTLKLEKCAFFTKKIHCLTDVIHLGRLEVEGHTTDAERHSKAVTTQSE